MRVLLTNDDGVFAEGLSALHQEMSKISETKVFAPSQEQSGTGHSITIYNPLRVNKVDKDGKFFGYAVDGTPADCVKIAVRKLLRKKPDILISGINQGANIATNMLYSGTVSAAIEGAMHGIPSLAVSQEIRDDHPVDFEFAAQFTSQVAKMVFKNGLPDNVSLNVNIPACSPQLIKGVEITHQCDSKFSEHFEKRVDLRGVEYFWQYGHMVINKKNSHSDCTIVEKNKISITPIHYDLTNYEAIDRIKKWNIKL